MKSIFRSKTFYFNVLTGIVILASALFGYQPNAVVEANIKSVVENPVFIVLVNLVLRYFTTQPITLGKPQS